MNQLVDPVGDAVGAARGIVGTDHGRHRRQARGPRWKAA